MANRLLNWGLLSTARINRALMPPLRASKRNKLLAVASRAQSSADEFAQKNKIPRAYGSYEAMLADPEIDVIYNPLPNHLHAEWTIKAVQAGKHVLCEKPFALTLTDVDNVISAAQKYGKVVEEAFMYRHHAQTFKIKEMIENGDLGKIKLVRGSFTFMLTRENDVRLDPAMGGGSLWDIGCYPLSFTRAVLGREPLEVFGWQVTGKTGIDETFVAQLRFPEDIFAQFDCSFTTPFHSFMEIVGSEGTLIVPSPFKPEANEKIFITRENKTEKISIKGQELYLGEVEDMADAILLGKKTGVSLLDTRANVAAILALFESAQVGKPVELA
jgi:xylose dehydrogenase (NAD/NADP)